ncbi:putative RNA polymerase II subunit B1 CTD phosphatase RPAP2 isoform X2 [Xylocopa sonorina]|uniref:putative RNA polymerase II subunit B1 CTD phosphatase RPAP2 isoform X2 n=1 Tax=Xylocopa sonorina TaxID=1818115 RepID=UPI00403AC8A4
MDTSSKRKEMFERKKVKRKMSKAQMQLAIAKKKECDAKALAIVEQLLETKIDVQWLLCNLGYINRSHMEDVIEERAIIKLCGYVLCNNTLTTVIGQRYHISTKKNKIYDVTRRKNFCSSCCYGACNYLLEQMLTTPLWLRDKEEVPEFKILLGKDEFKKSMPGDEICVRDINTVPNPENKNEHVQNDRMWNNSENTDSSTHLEINAYNECTVENSKMINESTLISNVIEEPDMFKEQFSKNFNKECGDVKNSSVNLKDTDNIENYINHDTVEKKSSSVDNSLVDNILSEVSINLNNDVNLLNKNTNKNVRNEVATEHGITITKQNATVNNKNHVQELEQNKSKRLVKKISTKTKQSREFYNLAMHVEQSAREWITEDTISLLSGEEDVKNRLLENIIQHDRYLHLCKELNKLQLEDEKDNHTDSIANTLKPLPHLSVLQEEGKKMELKVRAFYSGNMIIKNPSDITQNIAKTTEKDDFSPVLPLTDAHSPKILRRRIFLDKLNKILPDLLRALASNKLPQYVCSNEKSTMIKTLINTFSLSAGNIIFKSAEWTLVGLIIIKMLSMIDPQLKTLLSTKQASMYISMILMSYKLDSNYLDRLVMELINNVELSNSI